MLELEAVLQQFDVAKQDIEKAKIYQAKFGGSLERILLNMGSLSEDALPEIYSRLLDAPIITTEQVEAFQQPTEKISINESFINEKGWVVYKFENQCWYFVTASPLDWQVSQYLESQLSNYQIIIASERDLELLKIATLSESDNFSENELLTDVEEDKLRELASEAPTVNLLNSLISKALKQGASDMHLEPHHGRYRVRYRIDGVLHEIDKLPSRLQLAVISRLKILSDMDIAEKRRPQDGKIEMRIANIPLDIRVSALPLNDGESMVLRFLRKDSVTYDMEKLGLSQDIQANIREDLANTAGVVLLTGPTGSGKTTTLYTFLNELNDEDVKIITLEDPVEYQMDGVNQVQVKPEIGFDFSSGLRSIVRQDPDVIMVGEIRDKETANIAMQSALTGHLVFSTVHTNDAPTAYTRLLDLGVEEFLLNAALVSIVAQRLARQLCPHCAEAAPNSAELIEKYQLRDLADRYNVNDIALMSPKGCDSCNGTGYKGRMAIIEYLRADTHISALPKDEHFIFNAREYNREQGNRTLFEDGLLKAIKGNTTIDEVIRVCG